ncbi:efflux RND transporter periplasmic adaptor subunit [bacterium D16-76]|nr:efflux RND transporter periplasmic adaptor subunit [bacterium D16-76]
MKNKKKPLIIVLSSLAVLAVFAVCFWFFWLKDYLAAQNAAPAYVNSVSSITGMNAGAVPRYAGVVEPQKITKVNKDESKTVAQVLVTEGDEVHIGDPLFAYDTDEMQLSLKQAELELEGIANQITTLKNHKTTLEAEKKKASSDEQVSYTVQIQSVELEIKNAEYNSSVKKTEIDKLNHSLQNAQVLSEADGIIKEINMTPKTDATGQPAPFISILSSGEFRIKGTVSELNIGSIYEGQMVVVHSRVDEGQIWAGTVESIDREPSQDQNNSMMYYGGMDSGQQSSKYDFYVLLNNPEGLLLGQHVYIEPDTGESAVRTGLWLPASYVAHDDIGSFVWARDEKERLERRMVMLGEYDSDNDMYEIISGLSTLDYIAYPSDSLVVGGPTTMDASQQFEEGDMDPGIDSMLPEGGEGFVEDGVVDVPGGNMEDIPDGGDDGLGTDDVEGAAEPVEDGGALAGAASPGDLMVR